MTKYKTVVVEGRPASLPKVGTPEWKKYVEQYGDPTRDDYEDVRRIEQAIEWLNSNPADRAAKELEEKLQEKLAAPIRELEAKIDGFHGMWLQVEWGKVQQKTNLTLLWLIFGCLIYINVIHPLAKGTINAIAAPFVNIGQKVATAVPGSTVPGSTAPSSTKLKAQKVVQLAEGWVGKEFNPGVSAQCAFFVRHVLDRAGVKVGVSNRSLDGNVRGDGGKSEGPGMARSFFGSDIGLLIKSPKDLQPGDLVAFADTYGNWPKGSITHVGIYVGNGQMVDRPTAARPVQKRSISTFKFAGGVRPFAYGGGAR